MAVKHLLNILSLLILTELVDQIHSKYSNSLLQQINIRTNAEICANRCNQIKCNAWLTPQNCLLMKGKYMKQSVGDKECNCCPYCTIQNGLFESCHNLIPGFQISCASDTVCSKEDGFICTAIEQTNYKKELKKHKKYMKTLAEDKNAYYEAIAKKMINTVPEHQRPLKRVPRSPYKVGIRFGSKKGETIIPVDTSDGGSGALVEQRKKINAISGGNANSINSNIGPTFIINNNYRYSANQPLVGQSIKMSKEGNLIYETKGNSNAYTQSTTSSGFSVPSINILPVENEIASSSPPVQSSAQSIISTTAAPTTLEPQDSLLGKANTVSSPAPTTQKIPTLLPIDNSIPSSNPPPSDAPVLLQMAPIASPIEPLPAFPPLEPLSIAQTTEQIITTVSTGKPVSKKLVEFEYNRNMWRKVSENNSTCTGYPTDAELNALYIKDPTPVNGDRAILEEEEE